MRHIAVGVVLVCALALVCAAPANAESLEVGRLSNNTGYDLSSQFGIELLSVDADTVSFTFTNDYDSTDADTVEATITRVWFASDLGTLLDFSPVTDSESAGVSFSSPAPGGVPGDVNDWTGIGYSTREDQRDITYGIDASGEYLTLQMDLQTGVSFAELVGAFGGTSTLGGYGIAFHVQAIGGDDGDSDRYGVVPEPTSVALFGLGAVGLAALRRRRRA